MRLYSFRALLLAAGSFVTAPARAEEEIVVTATRRPAAVHQLPARIDVIDRSDIEANSLKTLAEAIGTQAVQAGGAGQQASVFLRGANSSHVLALFDGVRLNDASNPAGQYDFGQDLLGALGRVEILRGPASAIYGSDAIGGVVNLIPRRGGGSAFEPFLETALGSHGLHWLTLGAAGDAHDLEYGLTADHFQTDGYDLVPARMATHAGDPDGARVSSATMSGRVDAGGYAFDVLARVRDSQASYDTFSGGPFFDLRADDPDLESGAWQTLWRVGAETAAEGAWTFRLAGGQVRTDRTETDGGATAHSAASQRDFADAMARTEFHGGGITLGASYERNEIETIPQFANPLSAEETQRAAFVIAQAPVSDALIATASLRVDEFEAFGERATYGAGAVFARAPFRLHAAAGTGFRAPSLSERFETSAFNVGNPDLRPEQSQSWQLGADWSVDGLRLAATYFQTRIEDLIEYDFGGLQNTNIGQAKIDGVELRADAAVSAWATLQMTYDWTDARDAAGDRLARRPEHSWSVSATIRPNEHSSVVLSWRTVGERTDVVYDDAGAFLTTAGVVDGSGVGALAATYDLDARTQAFVRIDNITDEIYEQPAAFAGEPRTAMVGIRARP